MTPTEPSEYRLSRPFLARFVGAYLVGLAVVMFAATALVAVTGAPPDLLALLLVLALVGLFGLSAWLRRTAVVQLDAGGYKVRLIRGAGVKQASWSDVEDVVAATPHGIASVVVRLRDGRTTTVPVAALEVDREEFARELAARLDRGQGLRPL